jgi:anthranilate phosphoribosyltransferase
MMDIRQTALAEGIQMVGVGKQGSKNCSHEQIQKIIKDAQSDQVSSAQLGAFFGALWMKGVTEEEESLNVLFPENCVDKPERGIHFVLKLTPEYIKELLVKIIKGKILNYSEASTIAEYLFKNENQDEAGMAFIASALRVRYTEPIEYAAIFAQIQKTIRSQYKPIHIHKTILQIAEPFDGVERSHLLTPILARHFANKGFQVVVQTGRSAGPKFGLNLKGIIEQLQISPLKNSGDLEAMPAQESYVDQMDLSLELDRWVELRKKILKRPFLATLEKYVNPFGLNIFMASAFHHTFTDKMVEIAEEIGFPAIIISFKGIEGSLGLSLGRTAQVICSVRQSNGKYIRETIEANPEHYGFEKQVDPKMTSQEVAENVRLIQNYLQYGDSSDTYFNRRVSYTIQVYDKALSWVNEQMQKAGTLSQAQLN